MLIMGADYHRAFNKSHMWIPKPGTYKSGDWSILGKRRSST
jgi:hypothetical protein